MIYGTAWKKEKTTELVKLAFSNGFRSFDTANQPKHYHEPGLGKALADIFASGVKRDEISIQTKFTPVDGHDGRVPYDLKSSVSEQVKQSFSGSLQNLGVEYLDSYLLHGPYHHPGLGDEDYAVWSEFSTLFQSKKVKKIGISNVNAQQLVTLVNDSETKPMAVQNRCFASRGWDRQVRNICREHNIEYQGFSLLTANPQVLADSKVLQMAESHQATPEQIIFKFSIDIGMNPLTGTTNSSHMKSDLGNSSINLTRAEIDYIENAFD